MIRETAVEGISPSSVAIDTGTDATHPKYRPDIDGLRAFAVLGVLLYHAGFTWIPGGYVGVDIFFVISGFLISAILQNEIGAGRFSVAGFYSRRICRIVPAFVVMAAGTSVLAYIYLFPVDLEIYGRSLVSAALSVSNVYLRSLSGYFDATASTQPLVHTWSLAVEEQFYLFLPIYLMLSCKLFISFGRIGILALLGVSFGLSALLLGNHPGATFYLIPTRAWELLVGTVLSFPILAFSITRRTRELLCALGAGLIFYAFVGFSATTAFPGPAALVPCLGAAMIIAGGRSGPTLVGKALSLRPIVFVGLISYSLYLWHWPIIVFQQQYAFLVPNRILHIGGHFLLLRNAVIIVASFAAATLSWRFVERPFRQGYRQRSNRRVLGYGIAASAVLACVGAATLLQNGLANRFSPEANRFASYLSHGNAHFREGQCFIPKPLPASQFDEALCLAHPPGRSNYLVIGDSHAAQLWYGLTKALPAANILQATGAGCKPVLEQSVGAYSECAKVIDHALKDFLPTTSVHAVLIAARWELEDLPHLAQTLAFLASHEQKAVVIGPEVEYTSALPRLLALMIERNDPTLPDSQRLPQPELDESIRKVAIAAGATYVSMVDLLCPGGRCRTVTTDGVPMLFDSNHFTQEGSVVAAERLVATGSLK